jgi:FMN-dependent NADH-azoreductase
MHLFHLEASIRHEGSVSRELAATFRQTWQRAHPDGTVTYRDLATDPVPYVTWAEVGAAMTDSSTRGPEQLALLELRQRLVNELIAADAYLIATPLYNWSIPAALKAWVDHLLLDRVLPEQLAGRPAVIVMAKGGAYGPGTPKEGWDYAEPWLRRVFGEVLGLDLDVVTAELTLAGVNPAMHHLQDLAKVSLTEAHVAAEKHAEALAGRRVA